MSILSYDPTEPLSPGRPPAGWQPHWGDGDQHRHNASWLAHVEAGRIGGNPPCPPDVAARREANERVLRGFFRGSR
ncbi:hypothetical protein [Qipengyuania nanhaisediminis]|uniref:hypothetical protein n=1 Tax=Qipengyuania nanhaisediminis TaxID=604088 RepID=UPI0038B341CC